MLLICPLTHRAAISHHIHSTSFSSLSIDLQTYDESQDSSISPCKLLRLFSNRIREDFILVPCDFIPPSSLPLSALLDKFRTEVVADRTIAVSCWFTPPPARKGGIPSGWGDPSIGSTSIIWDEGTGTLLHIDTPDNLDRNSEELELRMGMLSKCVQCIVVAKYIIHDGCSLVTLTRFYWLIPKILMCTFAGDPFLTCCRRMRISNHSGRSFFPGCAKFNTNGTNVVNVIEVINDLPITPTYSFSQH